MSTLSPDVRPGAVCSDGCSRQAEGKSPRDDRVDATRSRRASRHPRAHAQRGLSLVEALMAFLVVTIGLLGLARVQTHLRLQADDARQQSEAVRIAQRDIERQRAYSVLADDPGLSAPSYDAIVTEALAVPAGPGQNTSYALDRSVSAEPGLKAITATVQWNDRRGAPHALQLHSMVAAQSPALASALAQPPAGDPSLPLKGRSGRVPVLARDWGDGRSVFKPVSTASAAWVFDNATGLVESTCTVPASLLAADLLADDLTGCQPVAALTLSGIVRFSNAQPPSASPANDPPLPLAVHLALTGGSYAAPASCLGEAVKTVRVAVGSSTRLDKVAIDAIPASFGLSAWTLTGEQYTSYACLVPTIVTSSSITPHWSGRSSLSSDHFAIGASASERRVCRYSADSDGSGAIDRPVEHPDTYEQVTRPLAQQNFLVVRGDQPCPTHASLSNPLNTVTHQP